LVYQDIANHQLRTLRPYLLETALEFEQKSFRELLERRRRSGLYAASTDPSPLLERTSRWFRAAVARTGLKGSRFNEPRRPPPLSLGATGDDFVGNALRDALLELIFRPCDAVPSPTESTNGQSAYMSRLFPSKRHHHHHSRRHHHHQSSVSRTNDCLYLHHQLLPETLQLDAYRIQTLHADVTDLTVVYMLLMLFRELVGTNHARLDASVLDDVRKEIWLFLNEAGSRAGSGGEMASGLSGTSVPCGRVDGPAAGINAGTAGLQKLECERWRQGMKDVLLQIAARAKSLDGTHQTSALSEKRRTALPTPDSATLGVLSSWMDTNLRPRAKLFELMQARLRQTIAAVVEDESSRHQHPRQCSPGSARPWWLEGFAAPASDASGTLSRTEQNVETAVRHSVTASKQHVNEQPPQQLPSAESSCSPLPLAAAGGGCTGLSTSAQRTSLIFAAQDHMAATPVGSGLRGRKRLSRADDDDEDGEEGKDSGRGTRPRLSEDGVDDHCRERGNNSSAGVGAVPPQVPRPLERVDAQCTSKVNEPVPAKGRMTAEEALARNGLQQLAGEVRTLGARVAKLASFHFAVYEEWYREMVSQSSA
jgi:hypothetical protein